MSKSTFKAGFTLFELLISIAIISILAGIVIYDHKKFETGLEITNVAYRIALEARQAQTYGVAIKNSAGAGVRGFDVSYGLHFEKGVDDSFILFADTDNSGSAGVYDPASPDGDMTCDTSAGSECVEKVTLGRGNKIKGWCALLISSAPISTQPCFFTSSEFSGAPYSFLDIKFKRPNTDAKFSVYGDDYEAGEGSNYVCHRENLPTFIVDCDGWAICLVSPQGRPKRVVVYETGQISVEDVLENTVCYTS